MSEQQMATYTITPKFNFDSGKFEFLNPKNRPVTFTYLPLVLDVRGGIEKRDYGYLQGSLLSPTSQAAIEILMPLMVFPKGFLGSAHPSLRGWQGDAFYQDSYTLIQGNTRIKLLNDVIAHVESVWNVINSEPIDYDSKVRKFYDAVDQYQIERLSSADDLDTDNERLIQSLYGSIREIKPFQILVIPEEKASDLKFVTWAQESVNSATKPHTVLQNARYAVEYQAYLEAENAKLPKDQQKSVRDLVMEAISGLNVNFSRFYHYRTVLTSPQWLQDAVESENITLDTAIHFSNAFNRLVKAYEKANKFLKHDLEAFWGSVKDVAEGKRDNPDSALKIYKSHVDQVEKDLMEAVKPDEVVTSESGSTDEAGQSGSTGEAGETGSTGESENKKPKLEPDALAAELTSRFATLSERLLSFDEGAEASFIIGQTEDGEPVYRFSEKVMSQLYNASTKLIELLAVGEDGGFVGITTIKQDEAIAVANKAKKDAEKAAQSVTVTPDQVDAANKAFHELAPV